MGRIKKPLLVRGAGDLATGTILMLSGAGYPVIALETAHPTAIRREAAFSEAIYDGRKTVEGITCVRASSPDEARGLCRPERPVVLADEMGCAISALAPEVLIDAILAKKNLGTTRGMAELVIGLGPGFAAGEDVHFVVETMRGHDLGRVIAEGSALPDTGVPGLIAGYGAERVLHAPHGGVLHVCASIGDTVKEGDVVARIADGGEEYPVRASLSGVVRGMLREGFCVRQGLKMADIDPRSGERKNCFTVSDKSRCIAGSVLMLVSAYDRGMWPCP